MYSFSFLEPVCCSMSSSNCCFLICIQVSQEAGQVVWYSSLLQYFPQFIVIHTVKGFGIINKAEIDVFLKLSCFFNDPVDVGNLISGSSAFSKTLFQQHKRRLYPWTSPDSQYQNQIDYILWSQRWRCSIQSAKTRLGATMAKIMNSLLPNSDLNWRKWKPVDHSGMT